MCSLSFPGCSRSSDVVAGKDQTLGNTQYKINTGDSFCFSCALLFAHDMGAYAASGLNAMVGVNPATIMSLTKKQTGGVLANTYNSVAENVKAVVNANTKRSEYTVEITKDERDEMLSAISMSARMLSLIPEPLAHSGVVSKDGSFKRNCDKKIDSLSKIELKLERLK